MNGVTDIIRRALITLLLLCAVSASGGCATVKVHTEGMPPILAQDELLHPYEKVGNIEVRRNRYGHPEDITPDDYSWAFTALREEAARVGADAVILPEVNIERHRYLFYPTSHIEAKGTAIKFR
jgi:hypothetical protein